MRRFTNPLEKVSIASPCAADWKEMHGDARRRFCSECKLNVYNLSAMTKKEAEKLLMSSEGRLCVRFYRRADGTILTQNCPVGWTRVKQKASRIATATLSLFIGLSGGIFLTNVLKGIGSLAINMKIFKPASEFLTEKPKKYPSFGGIVSNLSEIKKVLGK